MENEVSLSTTIVWVVLSTCLAFPLHYFLHYWDRDIYRRWRLDVYDKTITQYSEGNWQANQFIFGMLFFSPLLIFCHFYPEQDKGVHLTPILLLLVPNLSGLFFWAVRHQEQDVKRRGGRDRHQNGPILPGENIDSGLWQSLVLIATIIAIFIWFATYT